MWGRGLCQYLVPRARQVCLQAWDASGLGGDPELGLRWAGPGLRVRRGRVSAAAPGPLFLRTF